MKKPLQNDKEQFLISNKGRLIGWGVDDVKNLLKNANRAKNENIRTKEQITVAEAECLFAFEWLEALLDKKISEETVKRLNSRISHIRYHHVLMHSPNKLPYWRYIANGDQIDDPELSVAYGVAHLLAIGAFTGLKRCKMKGCGNFFIGRPNATWCSKSCGSKYRVNKKRKEDRKKRIY